MQSLLGAGCLAGFGLCEQRAVHERIEGGGHEKSICVAVEARAAATVPFTFICCIGGRFPVGPLQLTLTT